MSRARVELHRRGTTESSERGAVIPFVALCLAIIMLVGAFAIDLGRAMVLRRDLQRVADIVALDASKFLTPAIATAQIATIRSAAVRSAQRNNWTLTPTDVHLVRQSGSTWTRVDSSAVTPDGVEVVVNGSVSYNFQPGGTSTTRSAVATRQSGAGVEIGTSLGTIDSTQAGMLDKVFGLFGGNPSLHLTLVSWQGLAGANATLGDLAVAAGSADTRAFLATSTTYGQQLQILASALTAEGNSTTAAAVDSYRTQLSASVTGMTVRAGDLLSVSTLDPDAFASAAVNALSLAQGEIYLARRGTALQTTFTSSALLNSPVTLSAQVVQPPVIAFGPVGTTASTGQVRVAITAALLGLVPVQLSIDAATGTATVSSVTCAGIGPSNAATSSVSTALSGLSLTVAGAPVNLSLTGVSGQTLSFTPAFTWARSQHVGATSLGLTAALGGVVTGLAGTLVAPLENLVVAPILKALGVSVAGADVAMLDPVCLPTVLAR